MSIWMRAEPAVRTRESQSRSTAWRRTSRLGLDEKAAAVAAAQHGERGGGRAEHRDAGQLRRGARQGAGGKVGGFRIAGADDKRCQPAEGRQPGMAARRRLGFEKAIAVAGRQCFHDRLVGHPGLDQYPALVLGAAGPAADLVQQLVGPLGGAQIAAGEAEIGVDHPDQGQHRKVVSLRDDLGPDQQIVASLGHCLGELGRGARAGQQVADHQRRTCPRKALRHLLEQAFDPRSARHQRARREAFRAAGRHRLGVAAMMA